MHSKAIEAAARAIDRSLAWDVESVDARATELTREEQTKVAHACIAAYLAAMEAEGFVMVPVEPTPEMVTVFDDYHQTRYNPASTYRAAHTWAAMIAARPNVKG